ncbi:MAG: Ppx/GppA phosphatase family protein [Rhodospirillales bacterium]
MNARGAARPEARPEMRTGAGGDARPDGGNVAVIDVGSNTVRLVVYDAPARLPIPMYNERAHCGLARGLAAGGRLHPKGVKLAHASLARFAHLVRAMGVEQIRVCATSAVRDAEDGPDFVKAVEKAHGLKIEVLSGADEARLSALGVLTGAPGADGALMDLGGGSVDLVRLEAGACGASATLPLGHLRLAEAAGGDADEMQKLIRESLQDQKWLTGCEGKTLYACGGSMRSMARVFIEQTEYPLHVVDHYAVDAAEALRISDVLARASLDSLESMAAMSGVSRRRLITLGPAAVVTSALLRASGAARLEFSGFGMREGQMLTMLPEDVRSQDPFISACLGLAERTGRFSISGAEITEWTDVLFENETAAERRIRRAAALLSDIGWPEHPDYRAEHAFHRVLRIPFAGVTHPERVSAALAVYVRYNGNAGDAVTRPLLGLIGEDAARRVNILGLALRLAHTISGSAPGILTRTRLKLKPKKLILKTPKDKEGFASEAVERRLKTLARAEWECLSI